jgi:general secretion pathway protein M
MNGGALLKSDRIAGTAAVTGYVVLVAIALALTWTALSGIADRYASERAADAMLRQLQGRPVVLRNGTAPLGDAPAGSPFIEGQTLNVAGATLLQRIAAAVQRAGGSVLSSQVDLDSDRAKDGWITLVVSCELEQPALQRLLYDVESGMPFLFIDQLVVEGPSPGIGGGRMRVLMSVSGQWWSGK